jgi:hypothetical protein
MSKEEKKNRVLLFANIFFMPVDSTTPSTVAFEVVQ